MRPIRLLKKIIQPQAVKARRQRFCKRWVSRGPIKRGTGMTFAVLNHCYDLDLEALRLADTPDTLWALPLDLFLPVDAHFPPEHRDLNWVYGAGAMADTLRRYKRAVVRPFVDMLVAETRLDALIAPSDTFYWFRPYVEELRARGIPTIVQDKEGTIAPGKVMEDHARLLAERYPPVADQFYYWNENQRDFWLKVGIDLNRTLVLGQPRSDFFFYPDRWPSKGDLGLPVDKQLVLAFTYDADAYAVVPGSTEPIPDKPWRGLRDDLHAVLRRIAAARTDVEVVVKAHPQQTDLGDIEREFRDNPMPNVRLMTGAATASHLIVNADVIVGFQTTALIEAMLTEKPVIYAGWGERHAALDDILVPIHHSGGCELPQSAPELQEMIESALAGERVPSPAVRAMRRAFTDRYFYQADGHCAERVLHAAAVFVRSRRGADAREGAAA